MGKIKILHVTSTTTGGSAFSLLLLRYWIGRYLMFLLPCHLIPFYCDIVKTEVKVYPLMISRQPFRYCNVRGFWQLRKILREGMFDIVHTHTSVGGFLEELLPRV